MMESINALGILTDQGLQLQQQPTSWLPSSSISSPMRGGRKLPNIPLTTSPFLTGGGYVDNLHDTTKRARK